MTLKTVPDYLRHHHDTQPEKEAVVFSFTDGSREAVTFRELYVNSLHVAKCLVKIGVRNSEFIAISMRNSSKWLYATFGAVLAGARPVSISFTYTDGSDVVAMMQKLQTCSLLFLDPGAEEENWFVFKKLIQEHKKNGDVRSEMMPYLRYLICHHRPKDSDEVLDLQEIMSWETPEVTLPEIDAVDICALFQSSGSTGVPKVIAHTHKSFIAGAHLWTNVIGSKNKIHFNDRPFAWIGGSPLTVITGHTRVTRSGYCEEPQDRVGFLIDVISREKCDTFLTLPPLLNKMVERVGNLPDDWPLETIITGGQPIRKAFANCVGKLCKTFVCIYGSAEFGVACTQMRVQNADDYHEYAMGYPLTGVELKIVDGDGEPVPVGDKGELYVKVNSLFKCYVNDPEKTNACFTDDGWYRTDDVCYMDNGGLFYCVGRKSEMILSGGFNVAPAILELTLERCHGVAHAVCVPVPHEILYQVVCACVIPEKGSDVKDDSLRAYSQDIHNDKPGLFTVLPTHYIFMKEFPQTSTGKTSRRELTKMASAMFQK